MRTLRDTAMAALRFILLLGALALALYALWQKNVPLDTRGLPVDILFKQTEGDADCIILRQGDAAVMIDSGEAADGEAIAAALRRWEIKTLDLMIFTHPDADHIGGAEAVLEAVEVSRVLMPQYNKENSRLSALEALLAERGIPVTLPNRTRRYTAGEMQVLVYPPLEKRYNKDNNYSLATLVTHGNVNMVFAGDAEEKRLLELMNIHWPRTALYKVAHHGRASSSSGAFIRALSPDYAVCTAERSDEEIQRACTEVGAELLYTGFGDVVFRSDGETLTHVSGGGED
ncbi:MBL fold metallo-hydrolase [Oscillospiraceae bacterium OttesenSCG-928-F05]|nr:MBL fold metallo-hydrolase [Oscillospiraceae bacterium OttesenSCG-928-F05]